MEIADREYGLYAIREYGYSGRPARSFDWRPTDYLRRFRPQRTGYQGRIKVDKSERLGFMDDGEYFLFEEGGKFGWIMLVRNNHTHSENLYNTLVEAAEAFYVAFYTTLTHWKFEEARKPDTHKEIAMLGKWITATEYYEAIGSFKDERGVVWSKPDKLHKIKILSDATNDTRDDRMFALGLGEYEVGLAYPSRVNPIKYQYIFNPANYTLFFQSGYRLTRSMDWWVWCCERYVKGEVFCPRCRNVYSDAASCMMKDIRILGPRCGFSRDDMEDKGELDPTLWDFDERYLT